MRTVRRGGRPKRVWSGEMARSLMTMHRWPKPLRRFLPLLAFLGPYWMHCPSWRRHMRRDIGLALIARLSKSCGGASLRLSARYISVPGRLVAPFSLVSFPGLLIVILRRGPHLLKV